MSGWIRVQREIFDHELFEGEPLSKREAWLWLIANVAWKDTRHRIGNTMCDVPRGSLFMSLRAMRDSWKWGSDTKVRGFLKNLENERMIKRKDNAGKTCISICNYNKYQDAEIDEVSKKTQQKTQEKRKDNALKEQINKITKERDNIHYVHIMDDQLESPKKSKYSQPEKSLLDAGVSEQLLDDWKKVRKGKPIPKTVVGMMSEQAFKANITIAEAVKISAGNSWTGFKAEWLNKNNNTKFTTKSVMDELRGYSNDQNRFDDSLCIDTIAILRDDKPHH